MNGAPLPNEKQFNIGVTNFLEGDLTGLGYIVHKTQNSDTTFFAPERRRRIANGQAPNDQGFTDSSRLLLSIHMNSVPDTTARGTETHHTTIKYDAKKKTAFRADSSAARTIHTPLINNANVAFLFCSADRGIKRSNFAVLKGTRAPALLFEICFISNRCQFDNISTAGDQALIADGIAAGVSNYLTAPPLPPRTVSPMITAQEPPLDAPAAVLEEHFEGAAFPPVGWTTQTAGLPIPHAWHRTTDPLYVGSGTGSALVGGESPSMIDEWLISPGVTLGASDDAIRFLWSGSQIWSAAVNASLSIRPVGTMPWTELWSIASDEPPADPFIYRERITDLSSWIGMNVEFGFHVVGTNGADFAIDDIVVGDFDPTALAPNDVCANAITLGPTFNIQDVTCYAADDLDPFTPPPGSCVGNELDGPDVFYRIVVAAGDSVTASVTAQWNPGLYLVDDCVTPLCLAGAYAEDGRPATLLNYRFPTAGTYYLVVDGEEGSCGPYQLAGELIHTTVGGPAVEVVPPSALSVNALPNPASGSVVISGTFPPSAGVLPTLEIYNVAGERLLHAKVATQGEAFSFRWDGRDQDGTLVAAGTYFVQLAVGPHLAVEKIVILR